MNNPTLIKNYIAGGTINPYRIVKWHSADGQVVQGAAVGDALMGVTGRFGAASGERLDVVRAGIAEVEYGGSVTRGQPLTSNGDGKAVAAAPSAGVNNRIIGFAEVSGVSGDIGSVQVLPGMIQG